MRERMLRGVAKEHRTPIDAVQPYQARESAHETALAHLNWLNNFDKHRVIHGAFTSIRQPNEDDFDVTVEGGGAADISVEYGPLEHNAVVMEVTARPNTPGAQVQVHAALHLLIRFGKGGFPPEGFGVVYKWVEWYIGTFEPVFRGEPHPGLARARREGESPYIP